MVKVMGWVVVLWATRVPLISIPFPSSKRTSTPDSIVNVTPSGTTILSITRN